MSLILHFTTATVGESVRWRKGTHAGCIRCRLDHLCQEQIVTALGLVCTTVHHRLTHSTTTAAVGQSPLQVPLCFLARNQFPVGILATNPWHRQKFFIRSSVCACGSCRRRGRSIRINHRVSPPDTELEAVAEEYFRRHKLTSGREVLRSLLGWLRSHYKCAEQTMQMLKVLNFE